MLTRLLRRPASAALGLFVVVSVGVFVMLVTGLGPDRRIKLALGLSVIGTPCTTESGVRAKPAGRDRKLARRDAAAPRAGRDPRRHRERDRLPRHGHLARARQHGLQVGRADVRPRRRALHRAPRRAGPRRSPSARRRRRLRLSRRRVLRQRSDPPGLALLRPRAALVGAGADADRPRCARRRRHRRSPLRRRRHDGDLGGRDRALLDRGDPRPADRPLDGRAADAVRASSRRSRGARRLPLRRRRARPLRLLAGTHRALRPAGRQVGDAARAPSGLRRPCRSGRGRRADRDRRGRRPAEMGDRRDLGLRSRPEPVAAASRSPAGPSRARRRRARPGGCTCSAALPAPESAGPRRSSCSTFVKDREAGRYPGRRPPGRRWARRLPARARRRRRRRLRTPPR